MVSELDETFAGADLDRAVWFPYYLPHWSSRATSAATYELGEGELRLTIADDQPLWCADRHAEPMRVSCLQTGSYAGPMGSTVGQQPFTEGLTVTEEQPTFWGCTPHFGMLRMESRSPKRWCGSRLSRSRNRSQPIISSAWRMDSPISR